MAQDYLGFRGFAYERLDGSVRGEERYAAINAFSSDANTFAFLLSTRAGGVGLNLVAADTVIFMDCDFNPQVRRARDHAESHTYTDTHRHRHTDTHTHTHTHTHKYI
jgi:SNF2 family DNA or RNA helicase